MHSLQSGTVVTSRSAFFSGDFKEERSQKSAARLVLVDSEAVSLHLNLSTFIQDSFHVSAVISSPPPVLTPPPPPAAQASH